jgi:hypothetical protein
MMRRRSTWVWVGLAAALGAALAVGRHTQSRGDAPAAFTDLDTALAPEKAHGWELAIPPKREGPYRLLPGGPVLGRVPASGLECRIRNAEGAVVEEIRLQGIEGCDQSIVYLETADGHTTMAALKRVP